MGSVPAQALEKSSAARSVAAIQPALGIEVTHRAVHARMALRHIAPERR